MILGEGRARERNILDKRVAEAHRQPPPSSAAVLVRSAPSHLTAVSRLFHMRSKEVKKSGEPVPGVRRATVCWRGRGAAAQLLGPRSGYRMLAGPRGRRAAAGVSLGSTAGLVRAHSPP